VFLGRAKRVQDGNSVENSDDDKSAARSGVTHGQRVRLIIGELYNQQFNILLYLTFAFYVLVTLRDVVSQPPNVGVLYAVDGLVLALLLVLFLLERRGTVNTSNVYLTPIPIAIAMLINGYVHVILLEDPVMLIRGILMIIAFGIVSLLPWIFWSLTSLSLSLYVVTCIWLLDEPGTMIGLGVGGALLGYGAFAMRYNSVLSQITLTLENEARADTLARLGRAKDQFIANMSHELRTPLTGLLGMVDLIDDEGLSHEQKSQLAAAKTSADTLGSIIKDLLDLSQLDAGKLELSLAPFDFKKTAESVVLALEAKAKPSVEFKFIAPATSIPAVVGDASRLCQIYFNLVGNALKFTDEGSVTLRLEQEVIGNSVKMCCSVEDTGLGIADDQLTTLFERFEQVDASSTRGRAGTGLGLSIAQELAGLMGSEIKVSSELGKGSRFWFDLMLPIAPDSIEADGPKSQVGSVGVGSLDKALSILVAEDNPINQMLIKKLLERSDWQVSVVEDGQAALETAQQTTFDLILMDIQMPHLTGEQVTATIRSTEGPNQHAPIIALTANCQESDIQRYRDGGFSDHIGKPVNKDEFFQTIRRALPR
jgi:signal transduction histidine kinase/CheY-like chemotaxis protein